MHLVDLESEDGDVDALTAGLDPEAAGRASRFHHAEDRRRFLVGRTLVRRMVARYAGRAESSIGIGARPDGKPIMTGPDAPGIEFNLSHSKDRILAAFCTGIQVGVDIEYLRTDIDPLALADRFFHPAEREALAALPAAELLGAFYDCWTRKEAYVKGLGVGIGLGLHRFQVPVAAAIPVDRGAAIIHDCGPAPGLWRLLPLPVIPGYAAALAVGAPTWQVTCFRTRLRI